MWFSKKVLFIIILLLALACNSANYTTVRQVKPINRNRYYDPGKDKHRKRVKTVKRKILKRSKAVKPPRSKPPKTKKVRVDSLNTTAPDSLSIEKKPTNEPDSTGSF